MNRPKRRVPEPPGDGFDRLPPQNIEAEQCTLGCMMVEDWVIRAAREALTAEDFCRSFKSIYGTTAGEFVSKLYEIYDYDRALKR